MKFLKILISSLFCLVFLTSTYCGGTDLTPYQHVILDNRTGETILYMSHMSTGSKADCTLDMHTLYDFHGTKLVPANSAAVLDYSFSYDEDYRPKTNVLQVVIIKKSTLDKYPIGYIIDNEIFDDMFVYDHEELDSMDFQIIYTD